MLIPIPIYAVLALLAATLGVVCIGIVSGRTVLRMYSRPAGIRLKANANANARNYPFVTSNTNHGLSVQIYRTRYSEPTELGSRQHIIVARNRFSPRTLYRTSH